MAIQKIHPQTFDDGAWTWIDPAKTYNNNLSDFGYFNEQVWDSLYVLAEWSVFESKDPWEDDGDIKLKITTIGWSGHGWGLRYSDLDSPNWHGNPSTEYHVLKAMSNDNVSEQTYTDSVPEGFDWTKAKVALVGEAAGPPETPTVRVFDTWGEGVEVGGSTTSSSSEASSSTSEAPQVLHRQGLVTWDGGAVSLQDHCYLIPGWQNDPVAKRIYDKATEYLFEIGGDLITYVVRGWAIRTTRKTLEQYMYDTLLALAQSGVCTLKIGADTISTNCFFVGGDSGDDFHRWTEWTMMFVSSESNV